MSSIRVGSLVKYTSGAHGDIIGNPLWGGVSGKVVGKITKVGCVWHEVSWANGENNTYNPSDLELVTEQELGLDDIVMPTNNIFVGDRVKMNKSTSSIPMGSKGTVVHRYGTGNNVGVEWDNFNGGHNCNDHCKNEKSGYYVEANFLVHIDEGNKPHDDDFFGNGRNDIL